MNIALTLLIAAAAIWVLIGLLSMVEYFTKSEKDKDK